MAPAIATGLHRNVVVLRMTPEQHPAVDRPGLVAALLRGP
ncbi:hypothetical protein GZL_03853 [Streptomyces sp. 769]|nr:hypothetical protein GZL_03853 [Streptomyces sp. 769]